MMPEKSCKSKMLQNQMTFRKCGDKAQKWSIMDLAQSHRKSVKNKQDGKWKDLVDRNTALFRKVYPTIFQSKRRRLVFKTGVIIYIQNYTYLFLSLYFLIYIFVIKFKHNMNFYCVNSIDRWTDFTATFV